MVRACARAHTHATTTTTNRHRHAQTGDAKTEAMLQQLLKYFGPDPENGLIVDGTLTCKQEWDMMHPDYLIPKPGYPSDVAVSSNPTPYTLYPKPSRFLLLASPCVPRR